MRIKTLQITLHKAKLPPWLYNVILQLFSVRVKAAVEEYLTTALHDRLGALSAEVLPRAEEYMQALPAAAAGPRVSHAEDEAEAEAGAALAAVENGQGQGSLLEEENGGALEEGMEGVLEEGREGVREGVGKEVPSVRAQGAAAAGAGAQGGDGDAKGGEGLEAHTAVHTQLQSEEGTGAVVGGGRARRRGPGVSGARYGRRGSERFEFGEAGESHARVWMCMLYLCCFACA